MGQPTVSGSSTIPTGVQHAVSAAEVYDDRVLSTPGYLWMQGRTRGCCMYTFVYTCSSVLLSFGDIAGPV